MRRGGGLLWHIAAVIGSRNLYLTRQRQLESIAERDILILGLGASGVAAAELALFHGASPTVLDAGFSEVMEEQASRLAHRGATVRLDVADEHWDGSPDLVVISPGIPPDSNLGRLAAACSCPVISELEFGYRFCSCPVLAITGTNGKTTTTELTVQALKGAGKRVLGAGNLGLPLSEAARKSARLDIIVAEVSSFQLEHCQQFTPLAAAFLNFSDDHLDRYPDMDAYLAAKLRLFANMSSSDRIILSSGLAANPAVAAKLPESGTPILFGRQEAEGNVAYRLAKDGKIWYDSPQGAELLLAAGDLKLVGDHNLENVCAALALCRLAGVDHEISVPLMKKFAPSAHRLELVAVHTGVKYINDSKATNPDALIQAIKTCSRHQVRGDGRIVLIAGGLDKRMDFSGVLPCLEGLVKEVYLIGECKERLAALFQAVVPCKMLTSLDACVGAAIESAESGDVVLLSPGCASQDMFTSYVERGNVFSQAINRRLGE